MSDINLPTYHHYTAYHRKVRELSAPRKPRFHLQKVGGIRFLRLGRIRISFCLAKKG